MLKSSQSCLAEMLQGKEGQQSILHWGVWCTVKQSMAQQSIFSAALRQKKKQHPSDLGSAEGHQRKGHPDKQKQQWKKWSCTNL